MNAVFIAVPAGVGERERARNGKNIGRRQEFALRRLFSSVFKLYFKRNKQN